jgi:HAMP domain-containing protein
MTNELSDDGIAADTPAGLINAIRRLRNLNSHVAAMKASTTINAREK